MTTTVSASVGRRVWAYLTSCLVFAALFIPFLIAALVVTANHLTSVFNSSGWSCVIVTGPGGTHNQVCPEPPALAWVLLAVPFVVWACYFVVRMSGTRAATLGMGSVGIKAIRKDGSSPLGWGAGLSRGVVVVVLMALPLAAAVLTSSGWLIMVCFLPMLANALWPLLDSEKRMLHDIVFGTRVVEVVPSR